MQLKKTFQNDEKEKCKMVKGNFSVLSGNFRMCHNRIVLSLQFRKLQRKIHESTQEWMGNLQTKQQNVITHKYDKALTEQFIHKLADEGVISEILREVLALWKT